MHPRRISILLNFISQVTCFTTTFTTTRSNKLGINNTIIRSSSSKRISFLLSSSVKVKADDDERSTNGNENSNEDAITDDNTDTNSTSKMEHDFDPFDSIEEEIEWMPDATLVELATRVDERLTNLNMKSGRKFKAAEADDVILDDSDLNMYDLDGEGFDSSPKAWDDRNALSQVSREEGFLGDCTLEEIAMDYSVPMFYLADVLCTWGVSPPIETDARLGDLVIGEQAFSLLEAVTSFDPSDMYEMFSDYTLVTLASNYGDNVELREVYQVAVSEGFSLPFGVHSRLRKEHVEILDRYFDPDSYWDNNDDDLSSSGTGYHDDGLDSYY